MRRNFLPFSRPSIGKEEIREVCDSLKSGWITTGPKVQKFELDFAKAFDAPHAIAVNSGTSGLHIAYLVAGLKPGDEVITTPLTFISTVSMLLSIGVRPVFVDIDPKTLNIDSSKIKDKLTHKTRAIVPVHFAGLPCDMDPIHELAKRHHLTIIEDAAHAIGTEYKGKKIGSLSPLTVFSFHPIKNITTGEGGMITTPNKIFAEKLTLLRFHGMSKSAWKRYSRSGTPLYDITELGYKYNMMDIQAALGIHQLQKLTQFNRQRSEIAELYNESFSSFQELTLPQKPNYDHKHSWHLYVVVLNPKRLKLNRNEFVAHLQNRNIGTGVHFNAVFNHSYYKKIFPHEAERSSQAHFISQNICSLPLYPNLKKEDIHDVITAVREIVKKYSKRRWI